MCVSRKMRENWKVCLTYFFDSSKTLPDKRKQNDSGARGTESFKRVTCL